MRNYIEPRKNDLKIILKRPNINPSLFSSVRKILDEVKKNGDFALKYYSKKFDSILIENFSKDTKGAEVSSELKEAVMEAKKNIEEFHSLQIPKVEKLVKKGMVLERLPIPINPVGIYIPGGSAPLFSTVLMLAIPAKLAGCEEIVLCTPPPVDPAILYTANLCGIEKVYTVGGAQAIGAMTYGTQSIPKCAKIFGPGNNYVTAAKSLVSLENTSIDMPAGPSEVLVFADENANPKFVASDLLSQAEHGPTSQVVLVFNGLISKGKKFIQDVDSCISNQLEKLKRKEIAEEALKNSYSIITEDKKKAIEIVNEYCPEHLIINSKDCRKILKDIKTAGSVFLGEYSPESAGDYASGTNHTLPTNGWGKSCSGVSVDSFIRKMTVQEINYFGLKEIGNTIMTMANREGLDAHKNAVAIRLEDYED